MIVAGGAPRRLRPRRRPRQFPSCSRSGRSGRARARRQPQPSGRQLTGVSTISTQNWRRNGSSSCTSGADAALIGCSSTRPVPMPSASRDCGSGAASWAQIHVFHASSESDIDAAFATLVQSEPTHCSSAADPFFISRRASARRTGASTLPAIYRSRIRRGRRADELRRELVGAIVRRASTPAASSRARSRPICRSYSRPSSSWSSISRPPRRSALTSRSLLRAPTR